MSDPNATKLKRTRESSVTEVRSTSSTMPTGINDLEVLESLKNLIKSGQHERFRPVPQPAALASIFLGPSVSTQGLAVPSVSDVKTSRTPDDQRVEIGPSKTFIRQTDQSVNRTAQASLCDITTKASYSDPDQYTNSTAQPGSSSDVSITQQAIRSGSDDSRLRDRASVSDNTLANPTCSPEGKIDKDLTVLSLTESTRELLPYLDARDNKSSNAASTSTTIRVNPLTSLHINGSIKSPSFDRSTETGYLPPHLSRIRKDSLTIKSREMHVRELSDASSSNRKGSDTVPSKTVDVNPLRRGPLPPRGDSYRPTPSMEHATRLADYEKDTFVTRSNSGNQSLVSPVASTTSQSANTSRRIERPPILSSRMDADRDLPRDERYPASHRRESEPLTRTQASTVESSADMPLLRPGGDRYMPATKQSLKPPSPGTPYVPVNASSKDHRDIDGRQLNIYRPDHVTPILNSYRPEQERPPSESLRFNSYRTEAHRSFANTYRPESDTMVYRPDTRRNHPPIRPSLEDSDHYTKLYQTSGAPSTASNTINGLRGQENIDTTLLRNFTAEEGPARYGDSSRDLGNSHLGRRRRQWNFQAAEERNQAWGDYTRPRGYDSRFHSLASLNGSERIFRPRHASEYGDDRSRSLRPSERARSRSVSPRPIVASGSLNDRSSNQLGTSKPGSVPPRMGQIQREVGTRTSAPVGQTPIAFGNNVRELYHGNSGSGLPAYNRFVDQHDHDYPYGREALSRALLPPRAPYLGGYRDYDQGRMSPRR